MLGLPAHACCLVIHIPFRSMVLKPQGWFETGTVCGKRGEHVLSRKLICWWPIISYLITDRSLVLCESLAELFLNNALYTDSPPAWHSAPPTLLWSQPAGHGKEEAVHRGGGNVHREVSDGDCGDCMLVSEPMALGKIGSRVWEIGWGGVHHASGM